MNRLERKQDVTDSVKSVEPVTQGYESSWRVRHSFTEKRFKPEWPWL